MMLQIIDSDNHIDKLVKYLKLDRNLHALSNFNEFHQFNFICMIYICQSSLIYFLKRIKREKFEYDENKSIY